MTISFLDAIADTLDAFVATIVGTSGHTYKRAGEKALYRWDAPLPIHGNLGSACVDQDILAWAETARRSGIPHMASVDTTDPADALTGYGTGCGGTLDLLVEPVKPEHRAVYGELRRRLWTGETVYLCHDLATGRLRLSDRRPSAELTPGAHVERCDPPNPLFLFGATPLAERIATMAIELNFAPTVIDWRPAYRDRFSAACPVYDSPLDGDWPFDARSFVLVLSHQFLRDQVALSAALRARCQYVGLLSSRSRRDRIFAALAEEDLDSTAMASVRSPVGLGIGARSDAEIAVSIAGELISARGSAA